VLEAQASATEELIQQVIALTDTSTTYERSDIDSALARARATLSETDSSLGVVELAERLRTRSRAIATRRRQLEDFAVTDKELALQLAAERQHVISDSSISVEIRTALEERRTRLGALASTLDARMSQHARATEHVTQLIQQRDDLRALLLQLDSLAAATRDLASAEETVAACESTRRALDSAQSLLQREMALTNEELARAHETLDAYRQQREALARVDRVRMRVDQVAIELSHAEAQRDQAEQARREAQQRIEHVQATLVLLRQERDTIALTFTKRLDALMAEVAALLSSADSASCPLCGSPFPGHEELVAAIQAQTHSRALAAAQLTRATEAIQVAERSISSLEQERDRATMLLETAGRTLTMLSREHLDLHAALPTQTTAYTPLTSETNETARADIDRLGTIALQQTQARERLAREVGAAEAALQQARDAAVSAKRKHQELIRGLGSRLSATTSRPELAAQEAELEGLVIAAVDAKLATEAALKHGRQEEQEEVARITELQARQAELESRLEMRAQRIARIGEERTRLGRDVFSDSQTTETTDASTVQREIVACDRSLEMLRKSLKDLEGVLAYLQEEDRTDRLEELNDDLSDLRADRNELERARTRFGEIATSVRLVAEIESGRAIAKVETSIQKLLDSLYLYSHLNRVAVTREPADILLHDDFVRTAVRPDLYASTGQLNVLALALIIGTSLHQRASRLRTLLLDEPVQNLDDLHFLGFIALVRRLAKSRQVILSTADSNISEIFRRQMKSSAATSTTSYVQYEWRRFDRHDGPEIDLVYTTLPDEARQRSN
jgi:DNA repair exonuclease SbcCD ATPase subunit